MADDWMAFSASSSAAWDPLKLFELYLFAESTGLVGTFLESPKYAEWFARKPVAGDACLLHELACLAGGSKESIADLVDARLMVENARL